MTSCLRGIQNAFARWPFTIVVVVFLASYYALATLQIQTERHSFPKAIHQQTDPLPCLRIIEIETLGFCQKCDSMHIALRAEILTNPLEIRPGLLLGIADGVIIVDDVVHTEDGHVIVYGRLLKKIERVPQEDHLLVVGNYCEGFFLPSQEVS